MGTPLYLHRSRRYGCGFGDCFSGAPGATVKIVPHKFQVSVPQKRTTLAENRVFATYQIMLGWKT